MVQYTGARAAILSNVELRNDGNDNDIAETGGELMPPAVVCSQQATSVEGDEEDGLSADVCAKQPRNDQSLPPPYRPKLELDEAQKQTVETMNYSQFRPHTPKLTDPRRRGTTTIKLMLTCYPQTLWW